MREGYDDIFEPVFRREVRSPVEDVDVSVGISILLKSTALLPYLQLTQFKSLTRGYWDPKRGKRSPQVGKCFVIYNSQVIKVGKFLNYMKW